MKRPVEEHSRSTVEGVHGSLRSGGFAHFELAGNMYYRKLSRRGIFTLFFATIKSTHILLLSEDRRHANLPTVMLFKKRYSRHHASLWPPNELGCRLHDLCFWTRKVGFPTSETKRNDGRDTFHHNVSFAFRKGQEGLIFKRTKRCPPLNGRSRTARSFIHVEEIHTSVALVIVIRYTAYIGRPMRIQLA